jgi:hypothetical protein
MKFFVLINPDSRKDVDLVITDFLKSDSVVRGDAPLCSACGKPIGMLPWLPPCRAEIEFWSNRAGDIAFGPGDELLVSNRFAKLYKESELCGLSGFDPVEIVKVKHRRGQVKDIPNYYCVRIARSRTVIDHEASGLILKEPWTCEECRVGMMKRTKRVVFEDNSWSGEDVFFARGLPGIIIASEKFRDFFMEKNINNGLLIECSKYSFDFYPGERLPKNST